MVLIRFILLSLMFYLGYQFLRGMRGKPNKEGKVKGTQKNKPLNLKDEDVEDAQFEDIENENK